jgi:hypothetical protein
MKTLAKKGSIYLSKSGSIYLSAIVPGKSKNTTPERKCQGPENEKIRNREVDFIDFPNQKGDRRKIIPHHSKSHQ